VADRISDLLLTPDRISSENLRKEGVPEEKIVFTGNIMIDSLDRNRHKAEKLSVSDIIKANSIDPARIKVLKHSDKGFGVLTLHRPSNVDMRETLEPIVRFILDEVCKTIPMIWTIHPRTRKMLESFGLMDEINRQENLVLLEPLGYLEMLRLNMEARIILTDSGGLQEECTVLGTPCLTLRWNTERPITLKENGGASVLVGNSIDLIRKEFYHAVEKPRKPVRPEYWDGNSAERCLEAILSYENLTSKEGVTEFQELSDTKKTF